MDHTVIESNFNIDLGSRLRADRTILLAGYRSSRLYPEPLRLVEFYDDENEVLLTFLTNNHEVSALEVAKLYRNRWQTETFFKWIKQNLTVKTLWGQSENAVHIHVWTAIITYFVVARAKHDLKSELSIYQIMQILGIPVFDKAPMKELLIEYQNNQNVNEQLNLFDD